MEAAGNEGFARTTYLVQQAQAGNREALDDLFARYAPRVFRIVALRLGRTAKDFRDVEDVAQDALLNLFQKLDRFQHRTEGSFRNWVAKCVQRSVYDYLREANAQKRGQGRVRRFGEYDIENLAEVLFPAKGPTPSEFARERELESKLEAALLAMSKHHREVIILRHLCEMEPKEVAEAMGFEKVGAARQACHRALRKLKEALTA